MVHKVFQDLQDQIFNIPKSGGQKEGLLVRYIPGINPVVIVFSYMASQ